MGKLLQNRVIGEQEIHGGKGRLLCSETIAEGEGSITVCLRYTLMQFLFSPQSLTLINNLSSLFCCGKALLKFV